MDDSTGPRTRAVVSTPDKVWGEFDRMEASRGASWVPNRARELLAVSPTDLHNLLASDHLADTVD